MRADDAELLRRLIREAGELALKMRAEGFGHRQKSDGTFVTDVDEAVDAFLKAQITAARPEDGWLSEETPDSPQRLSRSRLWISDPIDGTRGFLRGDGPWGIGIALTDRGLPISGAVFRPADRLLLEAQHGQGARRNGQELQRPSPSHRVITPRRYAKALQQHGFEPVVDSPVPLLLRLGGIAVGEIGAAISTGDKNDWDIAPGHLLVTETGGAITGLTGGTVIYNQPNPWQPGLLAAQTPEMHAAVLKAVGQAWQ